MTAASALVEINEAPAQPRPVQEKGSTTVLWGSVALLMFGPLAFGAVEPWSIFVLECATALLFIVWLLTQLRKTDVNLSWSPIFAPMLTFLGLVGTQLLPGLSAYRYVTFSRVLLYISYGLCVFLITQTLTRTRHIRRLGTVFTVYGTAVASIAILQSLSSPTRLYWLRTPHSGGWIYGPYVNHNHYAGLMEMLVPIPMVFAFSRYARHRMKWAAASAAALMAATIFLSGSRGGMAAFAVQMAIFFFFLFRERNQGRTASALSALVILCIVLIVVIGGSEVSARISTIASHQHSGLTGDIRMKINRDTLRMFVARPSLGWGVGTFAEIYPQFRSFYTNSLVDNAHDDYLQLMAETGLLGFGIAIWFLITAIRPALRKIRNWPSEVNGAVALAAVLGVTGILVHSFADFNLEIPANAAMFYVLCGVAAMDSRFRNHREQRKTGESSEISDAELTVASMG